MYKASRVRTRELISNGHCDFVLLERSPNKTAALYILRPHNLFRGSYIVHSQLQFARKIDVSFVHATGSVL